MVFTYLRSQIKVGKTRRTWHSFMTWMRSSKGPKAAVGVSAANNIAGVTVIGTSITQLAAGSAAAVEALAGAAFIGAIAGPWAGITLGLVAIIIIAQNADSNRDKAHIDIFPYCWNIIDSNPPSLQFRSIEDLEKAAQFACTLLEEGAKQLKDQGRKFIEASTNFETFNRKAQEKLKRCVELRTKFNTANVALQNVQPGSKYLELQTLKDDKRNFKLLQDEIASDFNKAAEEDGAVFEMVRRCQHYSEYIQASHIVSLYYQSKLSGTITQASKDFSTVDFFKDIKVVQESRKLFKDLDEAYTKISTLENVFQQSEIYAATGALNQ